MALSAECETMAVVCGPDDRLEGEAILEPAATWPGPLELFIHLRRREPFAGWRPDLLWWLAEHGTKPVASDAAALIADSETIRALTLVPAPGMFETAALPLVDPAAAAQRLRDLIAGG